MSREWAAAAVLLMIACGANTQPPTTSTRSQPAGPRVVFPDGYAVYVEVAADEPTRAQGLMYRDRLPVDRGMIFFFLQSGNYPFWMKNTLIPLDMVWIDDGRRIVHIAHDLPPCKADPCLSYPPGADARYVLETAAGTAARHGLANGQILRFEGLHNVIVR